LGGKTPQEVAKTTVGSFHGKSPIAYLLLEIPFWYGEIDYYCATMIVIYV
jgi:hypothetical protein